MQKSKKKKKLSKVDYFLKNFPEIVRSWVIEEGELAFFKERKDLSVKQAISRVRRNINGMFK